MAEGRQVDSHMAGASRRDRCSGPFAVHASTPDAISGDAFGKVISHPARRIDGDRIFENIPEVVAIVGSDGQIIRVNRAYRRLFGWSDDELRARPWADLVHPGDWERIATQLACVVGGEPVNNFALRARCRDGTYRSLELSITPIVEEGLFYVFGCDVTRRRRIDQALERSQVRFRRIFEQSPVGTMISDPDGRVIAANPALCRMLGYGEGDLVGVPAGVLVHPEDFTRHERFVSRLLADDMESYELEQRYVGADGRVVWARLWATTYELEGERRHHVAFVEDISEVRAAEATLRDMEAVRDVVFRLITHDVQTPLVAIAGLAGMLAEPDSDLDGPERRRLLGRIGQHAERLQRIVSVFGQLDRMCREAGKRDVGLSDVDELARHCVAAAHVAEQTLVLDVESAVVPVDFDVAAGIISHLLDNVAEHTPPGATAWLRIAAHDDGLSIAVDDNGPGVPEGSKEKVFDLFSTGQSDLPRAGIGLWAVDQLTRHAGGRAWVEDRAGGGASFRVHLPNSSG